jgi:hypothetical protein
MHPEQLHQLVAMGVTEERAVPVELGGVQLDLLEEQEEPVEQVELEVLFTQEV